MHHLVITVNPFLDVDYYYSTSTDSYSLSVNHDLVFCCVFDDNLLPIELTYNAIEYEKLIRVMSPSIKDNYVLVGRFGNALYTNVEQLLSSLYHPII